MILENLTAQDIENMDYNQLIGLVRETNRIPGGESTVFEIANRVFLNKNSKVLEIGTSTGFTAIELSKLVGCRITSIDINEMSLKEAKNRAEQEGFTNIDFLKADVNKLPFKEEEFDLVIIGNVLSLMSNKEIAFSECRRVCKKNGFLAAVPMYYLEIPPKDLVESVSNAIKVDIVPLYKEDWSNFFNFGNLEIYWDKKYKFDYIENSIVENFVNTILESDHLKELTKETLDVLKIKYKKYMLLFRDNLSKMGYSIILLSNKQIWNDQELFTSKEI